jgi:4-amino-4-deoxy-L-arabinose transferase-like glycosyltransferase
VGKFFKNNWIYFLGAILILFLFALRFFHLTILPIFADEAIYIRWAQVMKAEETLRFLPLSDGKEPLFMWIVIPFLKFIHDPLVAGRIVSVLSGLGTLIGVSFLSNLLFKNRKVAIAAGLIYAISPFSFFFDRIALVDSMLTLFGIWTFIFAYLSFTKERLDYAMLAGFALGGAWLTKSPALFFALMLPTLWLFIKRPGSLIKVIPLTLVTIVIGYGFYNILRLGPNFSLIASRNLDYVYPISHILKSPFDPLKPFLLQSLQWLMMMGPWELLILGLIGILVNCRKNWKQILVLLIWFLGPIVIQSEYAKVFTARYILFSIPFLIILAASIFTGLTAKWLQIVVYGLLAVFIIQAGIFDYYLLTEPAKSNLPRNERSGYLEEWTAGQGIKQSADYLRNYQMQNPGNKIVVGTEGYFGTLPDGLEIYLNDMPQITIVGVGINLTTVPSSLIESRKSGNDTFLLINQSRLLADPVKIGLEAIDTYPKAAKPDGSHDNLLFLRLN